MDNSNTHFVQAFYEIFPMEECERLLGALIYLPTKTLKSA